MISDEDISGLYGEWLDVKCHDYENKILILDVNEKG